MALPVVCCSVLQCVAVCCSVLRCVASVAVCRERLRQQNTRCFYQWFCLQRIAECCRVLQSVAVCCSFFSVLRCVEKDFHNKTHAIFLSMVLSAVCCSVLQRVAVCCSVLRCVAVCCSVLQCAAAYCCVLQRVAACCSVLQCV